MKSQQMKNEILDTQVDVTTKQSELKKEILSSNEICWLVSFINIPEFEYSKKS